MVMEHMVLEHMVLDHKSRSKSQKKKTNLLPVIVTLFLMISSRLDTCSTKSVSSRRMCRFTSSCIFLDMGSSRIYKIINTIV